MALEIYKHYMMKPDEDPKKRLRNRKAALPVWEGSPAPAALRAVTVVASTDAMLLSALLSSMTVVPPTLIAIFVSFTR